MDSSSPTPPLPAPPDDEPAVIYSRFPLPRFDAVPPVDPVAVGEVAAAARAAAYADPSVAAIAPHVDIAFYRAIYPDIGRTKLDPVLHYHGPGWREGRRPNTWFDTRYYLQSNPDIRAAGVNPLRHFISHGRREGRLPRRPGGDWRVVVDRVLPPAVRKLGYDAPRNAPELDTDTLATALAARCVGARGLVVSVSHDRYIDITGGVQIFIADEQMLFNGDGFTYLHLSPAIARPGFDPGDDAAEPNVLQVILDGRFLGLIPAPSAVACLRAVPPAPVRLFVVHSPFGHRAADLMALADVLDSQENCFWLHDYASVCEGYNLLRDDAVFCGGPPQDSMACRVCVYGAGRPAHRATLHALFEMLGFHVLAPSQAALDLWLRAAELPYRSARVHANARLEPSAAQPTDAPPRPVRVAFVGYPLPHKGWPLFRDLVQQLRPLESYRFHHFSTVETLQPMDGLVCISTRVDRYDRFATIAALAGHAIDLVLVLSPWPETFSYVTYEAFAAGADVITLAGTGNVAAAVAAQQRGVVLRDADALLRFFRDGHALHYADSRRAAGIRPSLLRPTGTTATVDLAGSADAEPRITEEPDLRVIIGEQVVAPERNGDIWRFALPPGPGTIRLVSRSVVPAALRQGMKEQRRLGVAIGELRLDGIPVPPGDPRRLTGWHGAEEAWEWTSGDATLAAGDARLLEIILVWPLTYVRSPFAGA